MEKIYLKKIDLESAYILDQILLDENEKIILINFRKKNNALNIFCKKILKNYRKSFIFLAINREIIFDFDMMYELFFVSENIFFYKNKRIFIDLGTGNNNKIKNLNFEKKNFALWLEKIFLGIKKGKNIIFLS